MGIFERLFYYIFLITGLIVISCEDKIDNGDKETSPDLPPKSTFVIDFTEFSGETAKSSEDVPLKLKTNFNVAVLNVAFWNLFITGNLIIPAASFIEAFNHEPVREGIGWWKWSYNFNVQNTVHKAELHGKITDSIHWEMFISKEGHYSDFLWYMGKNNLDGTKGYWMLKRSPQDTALLFKIDWERNPADTTGEIKYSVIDKTEEYYQSYINHGFTNDSPNDAFYDIYLTSDSVVEVNIAWNRTSKSGMIKAEETFKDTLWHCWDTLQYNIDCESQ